MKVKLAVPQERDSELRHALAAHGIQVSEDAEWVLSQRDRFPDTLLVRTPGTGEWTVLPTREIVSIETLGRDVLVYAASGAVFQAQDRLYRLAAQLDPAEFLRISNSGIISLKHIRQIRPSLSMRFALTMSDGRRADVTRSYYYIFKETLGI